MREGSSVRASSVVTVRCEIVSGLNASDLVRRSRGPLPRFACKAKQNQRCRQKDSAESVTTQSREWPVRAHTRTGDSRNRVGTGCECGRAERGHCSWLIKLSAHVKLSV